jgi:hypothetical protein
VEWLVVDDDEKTMTPPSIVSSLVDKCANCLRPSRAEARDGSRLCDTCWTEVRTAVVFRAHSRL